MRILGIETSCDETAAAVIETDPKNSYLKLLSNVISSSLKLHAKTGGIIPEIASRQQVKYILPVIDQALKEARLIPKSKPFTLNALPLIDAIAVTYGPGLIGSLLVGVETAKTLAYVWNKPIIPVNHLIGHIYANFISTFNSQLSTLNFPALTLIVSGGHTDLVLMKGHNRITWLGGTRDDAAGEAFDKIGRLLGLAYPAGPSIEKLAKQGNPQAFRFPRPMIDSQDFDFSFSGLKTAVLKEVKTIKQFNNLTINNLCASVQQAIIDVLISKTLKAAKKYKVKSILLGGGVAANQKLHEELEQQATRHVPFAKIFVPQKFLCTDNAAMIATAGYFNQKTVPWPNLTVNPELYFV